MITHFNQNFKITSTYFRRDGQSYNFKNKYQDYEHILFIPNLKNRNTSLKRDDYTSQSTTTTNRVNSQVDYEDGSVYEDLTFGRTKRLFPRSYKSIRT